MQDSADPTPNLKPLDPAGSAHTATGSQPTATETSARIHELPAALDAALADEPAVLTNAVAAAERISAIDVLRGVALLGILLINITLFGLPFEGKRDLLLGCARRYRYDRLVCRRRTIRRENAGLIFHPLWQRRHFADRTVRASGRCRSRGRHLLSTHAVAFGLRPGPRVFLVGRRHPHYLRHRRIVFIPLPQAARASARCSGSRNLDVACTSSGDRSSATGAIAGRRSCGPSPGDGGYYPNPTTA